VVNEDSDIPSSVAFIVVLSIPLESALYDPAEVRLPDAGVRQSLSGVSDFEEDWSEVVSDRIVPLEEIEVNETDI
jgi:hypothetical protein